jgi:hypothetical protein
MFKLSIKEIAARRLEASSGPDSRTSSASRWHLASFSTLGFPGYDAAAGFNQDGGDHQVE